MSALAERQRAFLAALRDPAAAVPADVAAPAGGAAARRFAVYRNNVAIGLVDALAATFVATGRLVGDAFFRAAARAYVAGTPPASPLLFRYGATFPAFLETIPTLADYPYVADVARIDWHVLQACHAADAPALVAATLGATSADELAGLTLTPHPAARLLISEHPAASIWQANRGDGAPSEPVGTGPQAVLVTRPSYDVRVRAITQGAFHFFAATRDSRPLAAAASRAAGVDPGFDLAATLSLGLEASVWAEPTAPTLSGR